MFVIFFRERTTNMERYIYKYAEGLATTLVTKVRVLGHNSAVALYQVKSYYKELMQEQESMI